MHKLCKINWSNTSLSQAASIKHYLQENFSQKEINTFYALLKSFENAIALFPKLYQVSAKKKEIRRAVLSKELSVFYRYKNKCIEVLAMFDNRCDLTDWI